MIKKRRAEQVDSEGEESQYQSSTNDEDDLAISSGYESSVADGSEDEASEFPIGGLINVLAKDLRS
jgi:hypothetical protein